jgi:hypothetical protein
MAAQQVLWKSLQGPLNGLQNFDASVVNQPAWGTYYSILDRSHEFSV